MVVFPALSRPSTNIRASRSPNKLRSLDNTKPMMRTKSEEECQGGMAPLKPVRERDPVWEGSTTPNYLTYFYLINKWKWTEFGDPFINPKDEGVE